MSRTGKLTEGVVVKTLTNSSTHHHGIKVILEGGIVAELRKYRGRYLRQLKVL